MTLAGSAGEGVCLLVFAWSRTLVGSGSAKFLSELRMRSSRAQFGLKLKREGLHGLNG